MGTILVGVGFYIAVIGWVNEWHVDLRSVDRGDLVGGMVLFCLGVVIVILLSAGIAAGIGSVLPTVIDQRPSHRATLAALRSTDGVNGSVSGGMFLLRGYIGTDQYYFYYEQQQGRVTPNKVRAGQGVYVYERDSEAPRVEHYDWHFRSAWWEWFFINSAGQTTYFIVPVGTLSRQFQLQ